MTLLVTGGAGFIGSNFVLDWLACSDEPVVTLDVLGQGAHRDNLAALAGDGRHRFVHGDICDRACVDTLLAEHRPRAIVHLAAESHVDRSIDGPQAFVRSNVEGTFCLLEAVRAHLAGLGRDEREAFRFLHVGTDEVYGSLAADAPAFTEAQPYAPNNPYAASKAASDHLVRAWHVTYGLPVLITHCSNNLGRHQSIDKLIPRMVVNALAGRPLPLYGDGRQRRDWLPVGEHTRALRVVLAQGAIGETYNIGGGHECSNLELVTRLCALLDELRPDPAGPYRRRIDFVPDRPGHDRRYAIDAGKIRRTLGWAPATGFDDALRETVRWYLDHPAWIAAAQQGTAQDMTP